MLDVPAPQLIRSKRQSIALHITPAGELVVKAPLRVPLHIIRQFIQEKNDWIIQTLEKTKRRQNAGKRYVEGETFFYLGDPYTLQFADRVIIETQDNQLLFPK